MDKENKQKSANSSAKTKQRVMSAIQRQYDWDQKRMAKLKQEIKIKDLVEKLKYNYKPSLVSCSTMKETAKKNPKSNKLGPKATSNASMSSLSAFPY